MKEFYNDHKESVVAVVVTALVSLVLVLGGVLYNLQGSVGAATPITVNSNTNSYTDGSDIRQNVQAIAEQMAGLQAGDMLVVNSGGFMVATSSSEPISNLSTGGSVLATTTASTATTLTAAELSTYNYFSVTPNVVADMTYTFPALSTLTSFIPDAGDRKTIIFDNTTTTIGTDILFVANTGVVPLYSSSTPYVMASSTADLTFVRRSDGNIVVEFDSYSNN